MRDQLTTRISYEEFKLKTQSSRFTFQIAANYLQLVLSNSCNPVYHMCGITFITPQANVSTCQNKQMLFNVKLFIYRNGLRLYVKTGLEIGSRFDSER